MNSTNEQPNPPPRGDSTLSEIARVQSRAVACTKPEKRVRCALTSDTRTARNVTGAYATVRTEATKPTARGIAT